MPTKDDIGNRGEAIFRVRITDPYGPGGNPLFRPYPLGEKFPTLDFLVELVGLPAGRVGYFLAQVKATRQGFTKNPPIRLKVKIKQSDINRMLIYPGPTYAIAIDERKGHEIAYIASVNGNAMGQLQGMPPTYPLNAANMLALWNEVESYWANRHMLLNNSDFHI
jgi:hypothetical protein